MKILGLDPGLGTTGWGLIAAEGNRLSHLANGEFKTSPASPLPARLAEIADQLEALLAEHRPDGAAVEEVFVNKNPQSTLKLAQARGAVLAACGAASLPVSEHAARLVKKAVVGTGAAEKAQVQAMLKILLPGAVIAGPDAAEGLKLAQSMAWRDGAGCVPGIATAKGPMPVEVERVGALGDHLLWRFREPGPADPLSGAARRFGEEGGARLDALGIPGVVVAIDGRLLAANRKRDTIQCGGGRDRVKADSNDRVARNCEAVSRARRRR